LTRSIRNNIPRAACCGLLLIALGAGQATAADGPLPRPPSVDCDARPSCTVLAVPAQDRVVVHVDDGSRTVRLAGVRFPEDTQAAEEARQFLVRVLLGELVLIEPDADEGRAEDTGVAWVFRCPDGLFVNLELVRLGYATCDSDGIGDYSRLLRVYEERARGQGKGVWGHRSSSQPTPSGALRPTSSAPSRTASHDSADELVYVTEHGKKYHRRDCPSVRGKGRPIPLRAAKARGYTPCARCRPPA